MPCRSSTAFLSCGCPLSIPLPFNMPRDAEVDRNRLLFMTYNGWVMLAVAVGAFIGYLAFANSSSTKSVACH